MALQCNAAGLVMHDTLTTHRMLMYTFAHNAFTDLHIQTLSIRGGSNRSKSRRTEPNPTCSVRVRTSNFCCGPSSKFRTFFELYYFPSRFPLVRILGVWRAIWWPFLFGAILACLTLSFWIFCHKMLMLQICIYNGSFSYFQWKTYPFP